MAHADWLELQALAARDRNASMQDLVQVVRRSGTADAFAEEDPHLDESDRGSEVSQSVADAALAEIEARTRACGDSYPFRLNQTYLQASSATDRSLYTFLLLLSTYGRDAGPGRANPVEIFDEIAAETASRYFGGARTYLFGFPRRIAPSGFVAALDDLCSKLGEGRGNRRRPGVEDQKDAKLDLVAWIPFVDGRVGKLIAFGQCATGRDWKDKLAELQPRTFYSLWLQENPVIEPIRLFFMPFRIEQKQWDRVSLSGGGAVVFERCRIALHARKATTALRQQWEAWTAYVLSEVVRT